MIMPSCKYCDTENEPENIFCKGCGRKLTDDEQLELQPQRLSHRIFSKFIILMILCLISYFGYALVYPAFFPSKLPTLSEKALLNAEDKLRSLEFRRGKNYTFTQQEATTLYNSIILEKEYKRNPLLITIPKDNSIAFTRLIKISDSIPILIPATVIGIPVFDFDKGNRILSGFHIQKVKIGELPLPKSLYIYITPKFECYYNKRVKSFMTKIFELKIDHNKGLIFTVKTKKIYMDFIHSAGNF